MAVTINKATLKGVWLSNWSPALLFRNGEQGVWYDPSNTATLFLDAAGSTPVTAVEQPVGLLLDISKGPENWSNVGPELLTNGDFSSGSNWTIGGSGVSISGGVCTFTNAAQYTAFVYQAVSTTINTWYQVTITITSFTNGRIYVETGNNSYNATYFDVSAGTGTFTKKIFTTAANSRLYIENDLTTPLTCTIDSISFKKITPVANHAFQATSASRPVLSARYNILTSTDTLSTQSVTTVATTYRLYFTGTGSITLSGTATGTYSSGTNTITCSAGTLTLTVSGTVSTADLRVSNDGVALAPYQRVTTSTDYDSNPTLFPYYLSFDGVDDFLQTSSIDFSGGDSISVSAGVRKLSDAALGVVAELSSTIASNNGTFLLSAPNSAAANYNYSSKGTAQSNNTITTYSQPISNVLVCNSVISTDTNNIYVNNGSATASATDQGSGNYGNYAMYLGRRGGSSSPFNGRLFNLIVRAGSLSTTQAAQIATYLNGKDKIF